MKPLMIRSQVALDTWAILETCQRFAMLLWVLGFTDLAERVVKR
jgi:hypothetical protein